MDAQTVWFIWFAVFTFWLLFAKVIPGSSWEGYVVDHSKISVKDRLISWALLCSAFVAGLVGKIVPALFLGMVAVGWLFLKKK